MLGLRGNSHSAFPTTSTPASNLADETITLASAQSVETADSPGEVVGESAPSIVVHPSTGARRNPGPAPTELRDDFRTHASDQSASSHPESVDLEIPLRDIEIPLQVDCFLHLTLDGVEIPVTKKAIACERPDSYLSIVNAAQDIIRESPSATQPSRQLEFSYGNCTITGEGIGKDGIPLTNQEEWEDVCTTLKNYCRAVPGKDLRLDVFRDYSYRTQTDSEISHAAAYAAKVRLQIQVQMKKAYDGRKYIPRTALMTFTSLDNIRDIILRDAHLYMEKEQKEEFIKLVHAKAPTLLVMCVYAGLRMDCLQTLLDRGYNDASPPFVEESCEECHPSCSANFANMIEKQGSFKAATFDQIGDHQNFDVSTVIPIHYIAINQDEDDYVIEGRRMDKEHNEKAKGSPYLRESAERNACCGSGSFSNVYRVRIDPNHHELPKHKDMDFALKEFKDRPQREGNDFKQELRILDELRKFPHDHIVTHLATWTQDRRYYMLFPYAQCNLREYMRWKRFGAPSKGNIMWFLEQFRGLAEALKGIHDLSSGFSPPTGSKLPVPSSPSSEFRKSAWHHDLKPENILLYKVSGSHKGTFQIADFGSGKVHTYRSGSVNTQSPNGTLTYEPPEAAKEGKTSRPYDMWSLGCVFLELLAWAIWGYGPVEKFARERVAKRFPGSQTNKMQDDCFWQMAENGTITLRAAVVKWMQDLEAATSEPTHQHFKEVVTLIPRMLDPDRITRIRALDLWDTLNRICQQKEVDFMNIAKDMLPPSNVPEEPSSTLPRLSLNPPDRRTPGPTHDELSTPSNAGFVSKDYLTTSPVSFARRRQGSTSSSIVSPQSRNHSYTSSNASTRPRHGSIDEHHNHDRMKEGD